MGKGRRYKKPPSEPFEIIIERLSHDGRGIGVVKGKTVFVRNALPGEIVTATYTRLHGQFDEAKAIEIVQASEDRVTPPCPHTDICGGCRLQHLSPEAQIQLKQSVLLEQLAHYAKATPDEILPPLLGPTAGYRRKARLGVKYVHKKEKVLVGFREHDNPRFLADIDSCHILESQVSHLIPELKKLIATMDAYQMLPQIEVAIGDDATGFIIRHLEPLSEKDQKALKHFAQTHAIKLYCQPGKMDSIHLLHPEEASPFLFYTQQSANIQVQFHPTDFTQVNPHINQAMVDLAISLLDLNENDTVLDLFCGLGNFSLPMATMSKKVIGIEGSVEMVQRATDNANLNGITNTEFYVADLTQDQNTQTWIKEHYTKVLIDPPRSGAAEILPLISNLSPNILLYVSCNPATLSRDAGILIDKFGYHLIRAGVMDMFPHTAHIESIALFQKTR